MHSEATELTPDALISAADFRRRPARRLAALFVSVVSVLYGGSLILARWDYQASADSYYHFAVAREIAQGNFRSELAPRLPWTILGQLPVDHYFGFHLLLAPFAALPSAVWGLKLATLVFFVAVPLSIYRFLAARGARFAWAWCFLPLLFANQDWRYLMLRGGNWLVVLSILFLQAAFFTPKKQSRQIAIVLVCYAATLSYQGGLILLPLHLGALCSALLLRRDAIDKAQLTEPLFTVLGLALGLLVNPYMNGSAATFRFLWFHLGYMNLDPAGLYPGLREFGPVPLAYLTANPEFIVAPGCLLAAAGWILVRAWRGQRPSYAVCVLLGAALTGLVLSARAIRMREYAVPWAVMFFATAVPPWPWPTPLLRKAAGPLLGTAVCVLFLVKWPDTFDLLGEYLPAAQYEGARRILQAYRGPPVLNVAEGDYLTLRWEDPDVVAVQALSHYFLYPNRPVFDDVTVIRESPSRRARLLALQRFYQRGVRLVAVQHRNLAYQTFEQSPDAFRRVFTSPAKITPQFRCSIYVLDAAGIAAAIADGEQP
ncbi:MAG: hypothetical protein WDO69_00690 [Pseudomonadota bacterium]